MLFWSLFRIIFVVFSLYLLGDAFSRWDGCSYYATFSEFLPGVGLALILWSIVSVFTAIFIWMLLRLFEQCSKVTGMKIGMEQLLLYLCTFVFSGILVWSLKKYLWADVQTTVQVKTAVFIFSAFLSLLVIWPLRNRSIQLMTTIQKHITPLVWLFGIFVFLSVPLVAYHTWLKEPERVLSEVVLESKVSDTKRPNIILVTFDALAARNMSAYGYGRITTPFIDRWMREATLFERAEAGSNFTTPAVASLMTGKRVWTHQTYHIDGTKPIRSNAESLPAVLKNYGYFNIALVVNPFASVKVLGIYDSFDVAPSADAFSNSPSLFGWKFGVVDKFRYRAFGEKIRLHNWILRNDFILSKVINLISRNISQTTVPPEKVFSSFLDIIDDNPQNPFFAWIHVFPPHDPYLPPGGFKNSINQSSELRSYKEQEKLIEKSYKYLFGHNSYPEEMQPEVDLMRDYYDEFIKYIDKKFEDFIGELDTRQMENTMIILSSDHGESFKDGYLTHGGPFLYEQVTHIPLIIKESGQNKGRFVSNLVEQIDIPATVLDLADIPVPLWMEGRSLVPLMRGGSLPDRSAFSMNFEKNRSRGNQITRGSIAVWDGDYKLIHYLEKDESLLFNLKEDPEELDNVIAGEPETGRRLLSLIHKNLHID